MKDVDPAPGALSPFRNRAFAVLWLATVISNTGTWMHDVGAGWLMTEMSPSPFMVAAVQAATTAPIFLFALLAGAIADIVDRRQLLIWANVGMGLAALAMAAAVALDAMTPWLLLIYTFLLGAGAAFVAPAWQAIVPKLVKKDELSPAVALNSMGINVSRAIGPALAGVLIVSAGLAAPFFANALSVIGVVLALIWWRSSRPAAASLPPEKVGRAVASGLRFAVNSPAMRVTLLRAFAFFLFASAFWAMLPLVAREILAGGPALYGVLLGAVGAGAVAGAFGLAPIKARLGLDRTAKLGVLGVAAAMAALAVGPGQIGALIAAALAGAAWIAVLSSLNLAAQTALPDWVRARGLSVFLTVFFGAMSLGSLLWGQVAAAYGIAAALGAAAAGALIALALVARLRLSATDAVDHAPSSHLPEPIVHGEPDGQSAVMIQIEYRIADGADAAFRQAMDDLAASRRRNGGLRWSLTQDAADPTLYLETWWEASWLDHQRFHARANQKDRVAREKVRDHIAEGTEPIARHFLAAA